MSLHYEPGREPEQKWLRLDEEGGLPDWMASPTFVFVCVMTVVLVIVPGVSSLWNSMAGSASRSTVAVARSDCIGVDAAPSDDKLVVLDPAKMRGDFEHKTRMMNGALHEIGACPVHNCIGEARKTYLMAMRKYLGARIDMTERFNRNHGEAGSNVVHRLFSEPGDARIEAHLAERWEAGDFKASEVSNRAPIARWVIERPGQAIKLCPRMS